MKRPRLLELGFALLPALLLLAGAELGLRALGFRYQRSPGYMQFAYPSPAELHRVFLPDPLLLWRMQPGYDFGQGYPKLNEQGFRGPDIPLAKTPGTFRVACLGDSVTFGLPAADYPSLLQRYLAAGLPGKQAQVFNFGVPGYSSWQGRQLLAREALPARPDVVTVLFGWNDHWLVQGFSDHEQQAQNLGLFMLRDLLARLRSYQALNYLASRLRPAESEELKLRVPGDRFRENLLAMVRAGREQGVTVVLGTAPAGFGLDSIPDFFTALGFIRANADLEPLHRRYNQLVREVGREENVPVADLETVFQERGVENFFDHPEKDIIHPNARGLELIARTLADAIAASRPGAGGK